MDAGDFTEALEHYRKATVNPDFPDMGVAYHGLGVCYLALGDYEEALRNFRRSVAKNPYNVAGLYAMGKIWLEVGRLDEAKAAFKRVLDIDPVHVDAANHLARIYLAAGENLPRAVDLAEMAARTKGRVGEYNTLGWAYQAAGRPENAEKALSIALRMAPDNTEALYRMASVSLERGDRAGAERLLRRILELDRGDTYTREAQAMLKGLQSR